ncbi:MAG: DUF72 domain-containing protein [Aliiglaciecola sp.]|uniref:DUF72 domain-containing protein n=1 Tax=Aliiglaciecola sp. M165 TaxID=2593649 RepID=UPI00118081F7|nr:DUF72 domain-containing protein [Aliiglaciecola sp. M165]TRY31026.1 DUF72 domain-containing protein [Aliiglaciecola sp. M165]
MQQTESNFKFGCPMWSHPKWFGTLFPSSTSRQQPLRSYQTFFNSVEGNTSFYQLPSVESLSAWSAQVKSDFSFTFKFPREISHGSNLNAEPLLLEQVLSRFQQIHRQIGCLMLQLPGQFGPSRIEELETFLRKLPQNFDYAVEVRHLDWFDKASNEVRLNQLLTELNINRVIMDTRGLFACQTPTDTLVLDVQTKKPKVPTHVINTSNKPVVRFVGHPTLDKNGPFLQPWVDKVAQWLQEGLHPYFFFHMPDNAQAPWLASQFFDLFAQSYPTMSLSNKTIPQQASEQLSIF